MLLTVRNYYFDDYSKKKKKITLAFNTLEGRTKVQKLNGSNIATVFIAGRKIY